MKKWMFLSASILVATMGAAWADGPDLIAVRKAGFDLNAGAFGGIHAAMGSKEGMKLVAGSAKAMAAWAAVIPSMFPKGTETGDNTKALPAIWSDAAGFKADADKFGAASMKLADLAKEGNLEAVAAQVKIVGEACGACHKAYRAK
jgi:cytochrome c556